MKEKVSKKETIFIGYISGDYECFCLSKVPFKEWCEHQQKMPRSRDEKKFWAWHKAHEALTLYPSRFFPEECKEGKWKFKIIVEAVKENDES